MQKAREDQACSNHFFNSKLKLPCVLCVSSPTACQLTVYLPGANSPFTGTISCALSFGFSVAEPTVCISPAAFFSSMPVKASSTASLNWMRMALGDVVTTLPGAGPAAFSTACALTADVKIPAAAIDNSPTVMHFMSFPFFGCKPNSHNHRTNKEHVGSWAVAIGWL